MNSPDQPGRSGVTTVAKIRKNLLTLNKREHQELNDGFEALVAVTEAVWSYRRVAGLYDEALASGWNADPLLFLPWHRAYLLAFERALAQAAPGCILAYWLWSDEAVAMRGIPGRLEGEAYTDKDKGVWLNQLQRAPIDPIGAETYTSRAPRHRDELVAIARSTGAALAHDRFGDFSAAMAGLSRDVRNWTGGHFASDSYTAYDPIFWFHHANLDRLWSRWQRLHPTAPMPPTLLATELKPFSITVADILDTEKAGYRYDEANSAA
jgi:tyrosinase